MPCTPFRPQRGSLVGSKEWRKYSPFTMSVYEKFALGHAQCEGIHSVIRSAIRYADAIIPTRVTLKEKPKRKKETLNLMSTTWTNQALVTFE